MIPWRAPFPANGDTEAVMEANRRLEEEVAALHSQITKKRANWQLDLFADKPGVRVARPIKTAEILLNNLDPRIKIEDITSIVTSIGECSPADICNRGHLYRTNVPPQSKRCVKTDLSVGARDRTGLPATGTNAFAVCNLGCQLL